MNTLGAVRSYPRARGIVLVLIAATSWGVSGTVAQYLFHQQGFSSSWLVVVRLLLAGMGLLFYSHTVGKQTIWTIWKSKQDIFRLIAFGIIGMLGVQYTFFAAIEHGNAATATVLQYLAPVIIALYLCFRARSLPVKHEVDSDCVSARWDIFARNKREYPYTINFWSCLWLGNFIRICTCILYLFPVSLLSKWGTTLTVGWGMMIGGVAMCFIHPPWRFEGHWSLTSFISGCFCCYCWHINRILVLYGKS